MKEENIRDKIREICGNYMEQPNAEPVVGYDLSEQQFTEIFDLFDQAKQETWDKAIFAIETNDDIDKYRKELLTTALKEAKEKDNE